MRVVVALFFAIGVILLQIFLSKRDSKLSGLVLPIIAFFFALMYPLNMAVPSEGVNASFVLQMIFAWLIGNIPTIVLLAIYFGCRKKQYHQKVSD